MQRLSAPPGLAEQPRFVLGGLGALAGLTSAGLAYDLQLDGLQPIANLFFMQAGLLPIGVSFATAMAVGLWLLVRRPGAAVVVFLAVMYGWSGAVHIAIRLQPNTNDTLHLIAASLAAGAFGAGLTHLGSEVAFPALRRGLPLALTCLTGAAFGLLFALGERKLVDSRALVLLWQPAVAFVIGLQAGRGASAPR